MIKPGDEPIPGYRLERLLGRGQFGQVWRARSPGNTTLALKFLELTGVHGWKEFRAIQRVKQIRHAHLMPIVAIWLLDEQGKVISDDVIDSIAAEQQAASRAMSSAETLVVEPIRTTMRPAQLVVATLLANQTLGDRLRECQSEGLRGIPTDELLRYMTEAAKGLDYLNSSEHPIGETLGAVQHCDVKPDNIMLAGGSVVISDFGVSQALAQARQAATGTSLGGTPAYMAPECFANKPCQSTDQYSLAVTYYELRTGELPFREQTYAAVYKAHHEGRLDFAGCTPAEQRVLKRATAPDPNDRFATCKGLVDALTQALAPGDGAKPAPRAGRGAWPIVLGGLSAAVALVGGAAYYFRLPETPVSRGAAMAETTIVVDPSDATVTVNGAAAPMAADGRVIVRAEQGSAVVVKGVRPPERREATLTIDSLQPGGQHRLELPYSAAHYAAAADRLLAAGRIDEAAGQLREAIAIEPDTWAKMPPPTIVAVGGGAIEQLSLSHSGKTLASGSRDAAMRRWSMDGEGPAREVAVAYHAAHEIKQLATTDDFIAALSQSGEQVAVAGPDGMTIELKVPTGSGTLERIALAGDRWLLAAAEEIAPLPPEPQVTVLYAWDLEAPNIVESRREVVRLEGEIEPRLAAAHQEPWAALATTDGDRYKVRICGFEPPPSAIEAYVQPGEIVAMSVSDDDRWLALGGGAVADDAEFSDYQATLMDLRTRRHQTLARGHADAITAVEFAHTGRYLTTGSAGGEAHLWPLPDDWDAAAPLLAEPVFLHHRQGLGSQAIAALSCPSGKVVVCRHEDAVVLWDVQPSGPTAHALPDSAGVTAAATPDGRWLVTGHEDGTLRYWPLPRMLMVLRACQAAGAAPRTAEGVDQITRFDQSGRPAPYSPWGNAETERPPWNRPSAKRDG